MEDNLSPVQEQELNQLIDKFKNDEEYFGYINRKATSHILVRKKNSEEGFSAEAKLLDLVVSLRY